MQIKELNYFLVLCFRSRRLELTSAAGGIVFRHFHRSIGLLVFRAITSDMVVQGFHTKLIRCQLILEQFFIGTLPESKLLGS